MARGLGLAPRVRGNQADVNPREGAPVLPLLASIQLSLELAKRLKGHGSAGVALALTGGRGPRTGPPRAPGMKLLPSTSAHLTPASPTSPVPLPCS